VPLTSQRHGDQAFNHQKGYAMKPISVPGRRRFVALLLFFAAAAVQAQIAPPLSDQAQAARSRALAQVMTVTPVEQSRDRSQVVRSTSLDAKSCSMAIGSLPNNNVAGNGWRPGLGTVNMTIVVEAAPVLACGY
jgi:hypothetical protein